jgi:hypothetical protein
LIAGFDKNADDVGGKIYGFGRKAFDREVSQQISEFPEFLDASEGERVVRRDVRPGLEDSLDVGEVHLRGPAGPGRRECLGVVEDLDHTAQVEVDVAVEHDDLAD